MMIMSVLVRQGRVVDPSNGINEEQFDVLLDGGKIARVGKNIPAPPDCQVFDASGYLVCPGLVDLHVHCFPSCPLLGIDPDEWALPNGVTTVVDAGSAGAVTFPEFLQYIRTRRTRIFCFLHVSRYGLKNAGCGSDSSAVGELESLDDVDEQECLATATRHKDVVVGVKIRLQKQISCNGKNEQEAFRRALSVSATAKLPLMVHHINSVIPHSATEEHEPILSCPGSLRTGDIRTHTFHGFPSGVIDTSLSPPSLHRSIPVSQTRGIYHDVGHGLGSFSWTVAENCVRDGFWPDTISSDLHRGNINGPAYDLPTVMSKFLSLGMPLYDIIRSVTLNPAKAIKKESTIGSLSPGRCADLAVLQLSDCDVMLEDSQQQMRRVRQRLVPVAAWRAGERVPVKEHSYWPNKDVKYLAELRKEWEHLLIKDKQA